jgi:hypothetical protein
MKPWKVRRTHTQAGVGRVYSTAAIAQNPIPDPSALGRYMRLAKDPALETMGRPLM